MWKAKGSGTHLIPVLEEPDELKVFGSDRNVDQALLEVDNGELRLAGDLRRDDGEHGIGVMFRSLFAAYNSHGFGLVVELLALRDRHGGKFN